jgi:NitT/TauT family transport system ATP-binding protein
MKREKVKIPDGGEILRVVHLSKEFQLNGTTHLALEDIHFAVRRGELICILGKSGCGKTTLLKIIGGFLAPTSGCVLLNGDPVKKPGTERCFVFQEDALFPWLTIEENIAFGMRKPSNHIDDHRKEVERFLSLVGLADFRKYLPREISGGMKQRVALARVLILKPRVLLMDEPFGALDSQTREEMRDLLLSLWAQLGQTILFVTHDVSEAVLLGDRIMVMDKAPGRIQRDIRVPLARPRKNYEGEVPQFTRTLSEVLREKSEGG